MSAETLEEWAARVAPLGTASCWSSVRDALATGRPWTVFGGQQVSLEQCRALLAYRDKVAAGLVECERDVLLGQGDWGPSATFAAAEHLRGLGLHAWVMNGETMVSTVTEFGREVARVLADD